VYDVSEHVSEAKLKRRFTRFDSKGTNNKKLSQKAMHSPGIEPGTSAWKADILPLNYECSRFHSVTSVKNQTI
jgi:hypothetical protein